MKTARLYNRQVLDQGRPYAEALVLEGRATVCAMYLAQHDPEGRVLVWEQTRMDDHRRQRYLAPANRIPAPNWPRPNYVRQFQLALEKGCA